MDRLPASYRQLPALGLHGAGAILIAPDGAARRIANAEARDILEAGEAIVCHALFTAQRVGAKPSRPLHDVAELFAFVRPAQPCLPSPIGLARALGLSVPANPDGAAATLYAIADALLGELAARDGKAKEAARVLAQTLGQAGWRWSDAILERLGPAERAAGPLGGVDAWSRLPEWEDAPAPGRPGSEPVAPAEAERRLLQLVGVQGETRPQQRAYAAAAAAAFAARERPGSPKLALVEAGTGVGKTLGYLASATLWAERNGPGLWISTYTRNLQRQIMQEIARIYPDPVERDDKVVLRKGRENYLCLLNFEEAAKRHAQARGQRMVALGLIARWVAAGADGDMTGAGFPAFLAASYPIGELTDRRGECVYSACAHYRTCFIERAVRRARQAPIVVANHALVIAQATQDWIAQDDENAARAGRRVRYVFDEGHHLFDAADSGFAAHLSGSEMAELRRWIRGPEGRGTGRSGRSRGLAERVRDLIAGDEEAADARDAALGAAAALAGEGWLARMRSGGGRGPGEAFLAGVHAHVRARSDDGESPYGLEAATTPIGDELLGAARALDRALAKLAVPLLQLAAHLRKRLDEEAGKIDPSLRVRIEAAARGIERRARLTLPAWRGMLGALEGETPDDFTDWFEIARDDGRDVDVGLLRHWIDPTIPFAEEILQTVHGALITSATLRDAEAAGEDTDADWRAAEVRTGAHHLPEPPMRASFGSPFRWPEQARVLIVRDVNRRDADALAGAYRELFLAAGGGALGLFTAVRALRTAYARLAPALADAGLMLYAQHVDALDTGTLVDLFRAEEDACLLGTDALRDGVDVAGRSLRLCVFDKVPWPKPTILHKARRARFGKGYDDMLTRLRLKQAFGRLIRAATDKGVFVILESATPTRLLTAFPADVPVRRCGLAEAVAETREFLGNTS